MNNQKDNQENLKRKSSQTTLWLLLFGAFAVVLLVWAGSWWYLTNCYSNLHDWNERGNFGDMFGAINSLFAALALAFVITTLYLQIKSIHEAREDSQEERFQGIFFRLIEVEQNVLNGIEHYLMAEGNAIRLAGRRVFADFYESLTKHFESLYTANPQENQLTLINRAYLTFYGHEQANVGHYFRTLYNIVKFIDDSTMRDKQTYTNLLRAQLSSNELLLLFYNCLSEKGNRRFKPLVEKYALLENMPYNQLLSDKFNIAPSHRTLYANGAFTESREVSK